MASDEEATRLATKALELLRELGSSADDDDDEGGEAVRRRKKDTERLLAQGPASEALSTAVGALDTLLKAAGSTAAVAPRLQEFLWLAKDAVAFFKDADDRRGKAVAMQAMARTHLCRSEPDAPIAALRAIKEVCTTFKDLDEPRSEAEALMLAADAHLKKANMTPFDEVRSSEVVQAVVRSRAAIEIYRKLGDRKQVAIAMHGTARALMMSNEDDDVTVGEQMADDARDAFYEMGEKKWEVTATMTSMEYRRATIGDASALLLAKDAAGDWQLEGSRPVDVADTLLAAAGLGMEMEDYEQSLADCKEARALYDKQGKQHGVAETLKTAATGLGKKNQLDEAARHLDEAAAIYAKLGDKISEGHAMVAAATLIIDKLADDVEADTRAVFEKKEPPNGLTTEEVYPRIALGMDYAAKASACFEAAGDKQRSASVLEMVQLAYQRMVKLYCDVNEPDQIYTKLRPDSPLEQESTVEWKIPLPYIKKRVPEEATSDAERNGYVVVHDKRSMFKSKLPLEKAERRKLGQI